MLLQYFNHIEISINAAEGLQNLGLSTALLSPTTHLKRGGGGEHYSMCSVDSCYYLLVSGNAAKQGKFLKHLAEHCLDCKELICTLIKWIRITLIVKMTSGVYH